MRKHRSIWAFVQDTEPGKREDGDSWFNPSTGEGWIWDEAYVVWNEFRLTQTAGVGTAGYFGGFFPYNAVDKLSFSSDNINALASTLSNIWTGKSVTNSMVAGYYAGGRQSGGSTHSSAIDSLTFSDESIASISSTLNVAKSSYGGLSSLAAGYMGAGRITSTPTFNTTIDKLDFNSSSVSSITSKMTNMRQVYSTCSSRRVGYCLGGHTGAVRISSIDTLSFITEITATLGTTLPAIIFAASGVQSTTTGYVCGGDEGSGVISAITRLTFSDDTVVRSSNTLAAGAYNNPLGASSHTRGFMEHTNYSQIIDLSFSDESSSVLASSLSQTAGGCSAASDMN